MPLILGLSLGLPLSLLLLLLLALFVSKGGHQGSGLRAGLSSLLGLMDNYKRNVLVVTPDTTLVVTDIQVGGRGGISHAVGGVVSHAMVGFF